MWRVRDARCASCLCARSRRCAVNKATYPSLLGLDESRAVADRLIASAKAELSTFDAQRAAPLIGLADYIASRKN